MTRRRWTKSRVLAAALVWAAVACESRPGSSGEGGGAAGGGADKGKQVFATVCATCHGIEGEGVKGLGKALRKNDFVKQASEADLVALINEGRAPNHPQNTTGVLMPPKGGNPSLTDEDVQSVVAYLKALQ